MRFLLDRHVNFTKHVKSKQGLWHKKSHVNQINGLWSIELKQQLFCSWDSSGSQKNFLFFNFFGLAFFRRFLTKFLNISSAWKISETNQIY
jgi:hypothetical protein